MVCGLTASIQQRASQKIYYQTTPYTTSEIIVRNRQWNHRIIVTQHLCCTDTLCLNVAKCPIVVSFH